MDITLTDVNGDGTVYKLADQDRGTLAGAVCLTDNYKGSGTTCAYQQGFLDNAVVYDPAAIVQQAQTVEQQAETVITQAQNVEASQVQTTPPTPAQLNT